MYPLSFPLNSAVLPMADSSGLDFKSSVMVSECWDISEQSQGCTSERFYRYLTFPSQANDPELSQYVCHFKAYNFIKWLELFLYLSAHT